MEEIIKRLLHILYAKKFEFSSEFNNDDSKNKIIFVGSIKSVTLSDNIRNLKLTLYKKFGGFSMNDNCSFRITDPDDFIYYIYFKEDEIIMAVPRVELPIVIENVSVEETNEFYKANGTGCPNPNYRFIFVDGTIVDYNDSSYTSYQTRYSMSIEYWDGRKEEAYWGKAVDTQNIYSEISENNPYIKAIIKDYVIYPFYKEEDEKLKEVGFK